MSLIVISINREALPKHTNEEYKAWVEYQLGDEEFLRIDNPLSIIDVSDVCAIKEMDYVQEK